MAPVEGGTIDFRLYDPDDVTLCRVTGVRVARRALSGGRRRGDLGAVHAHQDRNVPAGSHAYSGDENNLPVSGACDAAGESVPRQPSRAGDVPEPPARDAGGTAGYCFGRAATIIAHRGRRPSTGPRAPM